MVFLNVNRVLFTVYLVYSIWNVLPTQEERAEREAEYQSDLEMKKLSMYGMEDDLSRDERREVNRQIFLNLPKTPTFANQPMASPRTTAVRMALLEQVSGIPPLVGLLAAPALRLLFLHSSRPFLIC